MNNTEKTQSSNAFKHESDKASPSSGQRTTFEKVNVNLDFLPNVLDNYDVVTYHYKLFITDLLTANSGDILNTDNQIIIAESGVTELTIDKVDIKAVATPSVESGTGTSTSVTFEIFEPGAAGMLDKLFYQSIALNVGNWSTMPFYLQLSFRARTPVDSEPEDETEGTLSSLKWVWPIKISKIKTTVTGAGAKYEVEAITYNNFALTNAVSTLTQNMTLQNVKKFGEAMQQLEDYLNENELLKSYAIPDVYKIVVDPKLENLDVTPANKGKNPRRNDDFVEFENKDATFLSGATIDKIIDTLLAQTEAYQKELGPLNTAGGDEATGQPIDDTKMRKFWRIVSEVKPSAYDPLRSDIAKEITYYVVEYDLALLNKPPSPKKEEDNLETDKKKLLEYVSKAVLRKKYNYIFTGLNDQVINFEIVLNNAFALAEARYQGIYANIAMSDKGVNQHETIKEELEIQAKIKALAKRMHNPTTSNAPETQDQARNIADKIDASQLSDEKKEEYRRILQQQKPNGKINMGLTAADRNREFAYESILKAAKRLSQPNIDKVSNKQYRFISDIDISSQQVIDSYLKMIKDSGNSLRPIARRETLQDRQIGQGIESNSDPGIQRLSSMFSVALHSGLDSSFQRIKLVIKGDPYWLFPEPASDANFKLYYSQLPDEEAIDKIKNMQKKQDITANLEGADSLILVRFRTPKVYTGTDDDKNFDSAVHADSEVPETDLQTFSGVYRVNTLSSRFEAGRFVQELDCTIDSMINILNIQDLIREDAKKKDVPVLPYKDKKVYVDVLNSQRKETRLEGPVSGTGDPVTPGTAAYNNNQVLVDKGVVNARPSIQPGYDSRSFSTPGINPYATTSNIPTVNDTLRTGTVNEYYNPYDLVKILRERR